MISLLFKYRWFLSLSTILVASVYAVRVDLQDRTLTRGLQPVTSALVVPIQKGFAYGHRFLQDTWNRTVQLSATEAERDELQKDVSALQVRLALLNEIEDENRRLRELLEMSPREEWETATGRVIQRVFTTTPQSPFLTVTLDVGSDRGVDVGQSVVQGESLVGKIIDVGSDFSRVLLLLDPSCRLAGKTQRTGEQGILQGDGQGGFILKYVDLSADLKKGDQVVSASGEGNYPSGIDVGTIVNIERSAIDLFQTAQIRPSARYSSLGELFVLVAKKPIPEESEAEELAVEREAEGAETETEEP